MKGQRKHPEPRFLVPAVLAVLAAVIALYAVWSMRSLRAALEDARAELARSEEARVSGLYDLQKEIGSLRQEGTPDGYPSGEARNSFAEALRAGEIESVLIMGDSITDGCCDSYYIYGQELRAEQGLRQIMADGENVYYESDPRGQGWVTHFRKYLLENTSVTTVHNNAIGGMSAKWFNARKEAAVPRDYDAIVVMLGTNDRWVCSGQKEFYTEYASLLSYLESRCEYLQVLTPIPAIDDIALDLSMDTRQVADTVLELCADKGYACVNLYGGVLRYAQEAGFPLDELYIGQTHPNPIGYLRLWRLIAEELGLNLAISDTYDETEVIDVVYIGQNRDEITEDTRLYDTFEGEALFPIGVSILVKNNGETFTSDFAASGTVITYRYENGAGKQIFKPEKSSYDLIRRVGADGNWGPWSKTNQDRFSLEEAP